MTHFSLNIKYTYIFSYCGSLLGFLLLINSETYTNHQKQNSEKKYNNCHDIVFFRRMFYLSHYPCFYPYYI